MQSGKLFENKCMRGRLGLYPFTPENLLRVGLALCTYLKAHRGLEKPTMTVKVLNFLTFSLAAGFMAGGGDVLVDDGGDITLGQTVEKGDASLWIENMEDYELRMVESILFSRYNMPRAEGEEVGNLWIQGNPP